MGRIVLGNSSNSSPTYSNKNQTIVYVDNPVEVIKEIFLPSEEKIIYVDKPIEVIVEKFIEVPVEVIREKLIEMPVEVIKEITIPGETKTVYIEKTKTIYKMSKWSWIVIALQAAINILLITVWMR